jgi:TP901 family phage tail tape measure protein
MADILLTVGVDTSLSYAEFQAGITSLVSQVNANPPKIKLKFDDSSLSSMKKQIESMTKAAATANTAKSMGGYTKTNSGIWVKDTAAIKANTQAKNENASATKKAADATKQAKASEDTFAAGTKKHTDALNKVNTLLGQVTANTQKWTAARSGKSSDNYSSLKGQITALETLKSGLMNGTVSAEQFENSFRSIKSTVTESSAAIRAAGENTQTLGDRFGGLATKFASWLSITQVIMTAVRTAKQMVSAAVEVESAMAQIKIVTGASDSQMEAFLTKSIALAKELGQSVTDVASSIETFARLGYNMSDSSNLAKYANIMANVGNTDVDTATTGITSIIKGYELDANDAEHVSDVLVKVGQEYAISAEELMAAFQRGGAALHASGTDFEKSAALFAATNASLQNAETTGTMWKTVSARIRGATTELEEMGEETDGLAQGLSKYREEIKALSGVDIMKDENTYKDMYDIFVQLAEVWDNMEDVSQSRVAEILGGTRNTSGIMSTITNIKDAIGAYSSAMDSAGIATEANNIYMDTTKAKVGELKAAFQELSSDFISSNFTKGAVEGLKGIVEAIDKIVETVGSLGTILAGLGLAKVIKNVA